MPRGTALSAREVECRDSLHSGAQLKSSRSRLRSVGWFTVAERGCHGDMFGQSWAAMACSTLLRLVLVLPSLLAMYVKMSMSMSMLIYQRHSTPCANAYGCAAISQYPLIGTLNFILNIFLVLVLIFMLVPLVSSSLHLTSPISITIPTPCTLDWPLNSH